MYSTGNRSYQTNLVSSSMQVTSNSVDVTYSTILWLKAVTHSDNQEHVKSINNRLSSSLFFNPSMGNHNWSDGILGDSPMAKPLQCFYQCFEIFFNIC